MCIIMVEAAYSFKLGRRGEGQEIFLGGAGDLPTRGLEGSVVINEVRRLKTQA